MKLSKSAVVPRLKKRGSVWNAKLCSWNNSEISVLTEEWKNKRTNSYYRGRVDKISIIFEEKPEQYGLYGDLYFGD